MIKFFNFHQRALISGIRNLIKKPTTTLFNITIFSFLISLLIVTLSFIKSNNDWKSNLITYPKLVLYIKANSINSEINQIVNYLQKEKSNINNFHYLSQQDAIKEFITESEILSNLDEDTIKQIPSLIIINLKNIDIKTINRMISSINKFNAVQTVDLDRHYISKINNINDIVNKIFSGLIIFIIVILVLIIYHQTKIQILHNKDEIKIKKLIGATNYFITLPLLFSSICQICLALYLSYLLYSTIINKLNLLLINLSSILEHKIVLIKLTNIDVLNISLLIIFLTIMTVYISVKSILAKHTVY
jgi:cell division transport system permease protein